MILSKVSTVAHWQAEEGELSKFNLKCNPLKWLFHLLLAPGLRPGADVQPVHASLLVDGERPRLQGDAHQPPAVVGAQGPPLHLHIGLPDGLPVRRGGSLLAADTPGRKCSGSTPSVNAVKFLAADKHQRSLFCFGFFARNPFMSCWCQAAYQPL